MSDKNFDVVLASEPDDLPEWMPEDDGIELRQLLQRWLNDGDERSVLIIRRGDSTVWYADGCEPEDATFGRDLSWIEGELRECFQWGRSVALLKIDQSPDAIDYQAVGVFAACSDRFSADGVFPARDELPASVASLGDAQPGWSTPVMLRRLYESANEATRRVINNLSVSGMFFTVVAGKAGIMLEGEAGGS